MSLKDYLAHQLRWARTYRVCRPAGYLAYGITHALVYSLALAGPAGAAPWAWGLTAATLVLRWALAGFSEGRCLKGPSAPGAFPAPALKRPAVLRPLAREFPGQPGRLGQIRLMG